jgi:1-acyl-sn-glycerol-3-phosphate acyltransferase
MQFLRGVTSFFTRMGMEAVYRVEKTELTEVPHHGPLIAVINHTGQVEAPLFYCQLYPRHLSALAKVEHWDSAFLAWVFILWEIVPVRRGEADMDAMKKSLDVLERGYIFGMAPEGTRNRTGVLARAQPGVAPLALHSRAPVLPMAHWGGEKLRENLRRLRRTDFHIRVGRAFQLDARGERVTRDIRQQMADEIMYQVAKLLPREYRGAYADIANATQDYIRFME